MIRHLFPGICLALLFAGCGAPQPAPQGAAEEPTTQKKKPRGGDAYTDAAKKAGEAIRTASDAKVTDIDGETVMLSSTWASGPSVLVFYRGHW